MATSLVSGNAWWSTKVMASPPRRWQCVWMMGSELLERRRARDKRRKKGERGASRGRDERVNALMPVSLFDMLLIPRQEYQQYLTGNVAECQVGKCQWERTGGWPQTSPLRWNKYGTVVLLRLIFFPPSSPFFLLATILWRGYSFS